MPSTGARSRFGEAVQIKTGRIFIVLITLFAYAVALRAPETIFELAIQYGFSGFAALSPLLIAALFWKGSTKWGALAVDSLDRVGGGLRSRYCRKWFRRLRLDQRRSSGRLEELRSYRRTPGGTAVFGFMPVVPMVLISALLMIVVSMMTKKPGASTMAKYFGGRDR